MGENAFKAMSRAILLVGGMCAVVSSPARSGTINECFTHSSGAAPCVKKMRAGCYDEGASQAAWNRCSNAIDKQVFDVAEDAIGHQRVSIGRAQYEAWKDRQTKLCESKVPFDRGGSGFGQSMEDCMADATASLISDDPSGRAR